MHEKFLNYSVMQKLTKKEDAMMDIFWERGEMFVKDVIDLYYCS